MPPNEEHASNLELQGRSQDWILAEANCVFIIMIKTHQKEFKRSSPAIQLPKKLMCLYTVFHIRISSDAISPFLCHHFLHLVELLFWINNGDTQSKWMTSFTVYLLFLFHHSRKPPFWLQYKMWITWIAGSSIMSPPTMFHGGNLCGVS